MLITIPDVCWHIVPVSQLKALTFN